MKGSDNLVDGILHGASYARMYPGGSSAEAVQAMKDAAYWVAEFDVEEYTEGFALGIAGQHRVQAWEKADAEEHAACLLLEAANSEEERY